MVTPIPSIYLKLFKLILYGRCPLSRMLFIEVFSEAGTSPIFKFTSCSDPSQLSLSVVRPEKMVSLGSSNPLGNPNCALCGQLNAHTKDVIVSNCAVTSIALTTLFK